MSKKSSASLPIILVIGEGVQLKSFAESLCAVLDAKVPTDPVAVCGDDCLLWPSVLKDVMGAFVCHRKLDITTKYYNTSVLFLCLDWCKLADDFSEVIRNSALRIEALILLHSADSSTDSDGYFQKIVNLLGGGNNQQSVLSLDNNSKEEGGSVVPTTAQGSEERQMERQCWTTDISIKLVVKMSASPKGFDNVSCLSQYKYLMKWCMEKNFELVGCVVEDILVTSDAYNKSEVCGKGQLLNSGMARDCAEGIYRVKEALEAHIWPNMTPIKDSRQHKGKAILHNQDCTDKVPYKDLEDGEQPHEERDETEDLDRLMDDMRNFRAKSERLNDEERRDQASVLALKLAALLSE